MKKMILLLVGLFFLLNSSVKADSLCDYKSQSELNGKASNIKASYELVEDVIQFEDGGALTKYFKVSILNLTDEFYIKVKNNINEEEKIYRHSDVKNGIINFNWDDIEDVTNLTIEVYSSSKTKCPDERYRTIYLTIPRHNEFSGRSICEEYTDFYLCQEFVTFSKVNEETFLKQLESYKNKNNVTTDEDQKDEINQDKNLIDYINEYKWIIIAGATLVIVVIAIITATKNKKQRDFK